MAYTHKKQPFACILRHQYKKIMQILKLITILLLLVCTFSSCKKDNENDCFPCEHQVVISADKYLTAPNDHLVIDSLKINSDCLKIIFSSSGCNGDTWELKLIDSGAILESYPPQRNLRLSLKNEELCDAWFTREISFDINTLQVDGNRILLNITNSGDQILYEYN
jgi:hypothetical protein